jgi:hypothetical protein
VYKVQIPQELYEVIVEALKKENLYSGLLREEKGKVRKNIFEEAYKHYVGKDDLNALQEGGKGDRQGGKGYNKRDSEEFKERRKSWG